MEINKINKQNLDFYFEEDCFEEMSEIRIYMI